MSTPAAPLPMTIDFVSDVSCPWCAIGLKSLEQALETLRGEVTAQIHFQPFELNPTMAVEGENSTAHLVAKYRTTAEQIDSNREAIRARGEQLGFMFRSNRDSRVYNTFDAHRLLHWADIEGRQQVLKHALLKAYFSDSQDISAPDTLIALCEQCGLDGTRARSILDSGEFAAEVRAQEQYFTERGIQSVPAVIVNGRHLVSGGQPPEVFVQALRNIASQEMMR